MGAAKINGLLDLSFAAVVLVKGKVAERTEKAS